MSIHDGHRQRLRERYLSEGMWNFDEVHALELMLCYVIPRVDTNPLAHRLLDHFGSFYRVLEASPEELEQVAGVGKQVAVYLSLFMPAARLHRKSKLVPTGPMDSVEKCGRFMASAFLGLQDECAYLLCLDAKCKMICNRKIAQGTVDSVHISTRKVVEIATQYRASAVVLAHNHPGGLLLPSQEDHITTQTLLKALELIDVKLVDHLIFCDTDFISVKEAARNSSEFCYWD